MFTASKRRVGGFIALVGILCGGLATAPGASPAPDPSAEYLTYLPDGSVNPPATYRDWVYVSSGVDMNYSDGGMAMGHHMFDNIFVNREADRAFRATGTWPDGTVFAREDRAGETKGSINKAGVFQGESLEGFELHVKDSKRFKNGWAFFAFDGTAPAKQIPLGTSCYSCHEAHGAVDTTFVQFYPTLIGIAKAKKTLSSNSTRETAPSAATGTPAP